MERPARKSLERRIALVMAACTTLFLLRVLGQAGAFPVVLATFVVALAGYHFVNGRSREGAYR